MTTDHARKIADEISSNIFGAGASETQRLGALAVSTINALAAELDAVKPPKKADAEPAEKDDEDEPVKNGKGHATVGRAAGKHK